MVFLIPTISSVAKILAQSFKLYFTNGKSLIFITLISTLVYAALSHSKQLFVVKPFIAEFDFPQNRTESTISYDNVLHFLNIYIESLKDRRIWSLVVARSFAYLLMAEATILVSAAKISGATELSITGLISLARTQWKRTLLAVFLKKLFEEASDLIVMLMPHALPFSTDSIVLIFLSLLVTVSLSILLFYVPIVCDLGIVVSVLEERSGFAALGRAAKLLKGSALKAFLISGLFFVAFLGFRSSYATRSSLAVELTLDSAANSFLDVIWLVCFTVFYWECKKIHGEEVEKQS